MKITLINPPFLFPVETEIVLSHCLGLRYISSYLKAKGLNRVTLIDALNLGFSNINRYANGYMVGLDPPDIINRIPHDTDLIGVSAPFSQIAPIAHEVVDLAKSRFTNIPIVMGGVYPSTQPLHALSSKADMIVVGEGEGALLQIADGKNPDEIKGVYSREHTPGGIFSATNLIEDLDSIPFPDDSLANMDQYFNISPRNDRMHRTASILTSRGCSFGCEFCSIHPVYGRTWRGRSAENVLNEMEYLNKRHGINCFEIEDDNFTLQKQRTVDILEGIIRLNEKGCNLMWRTPNGVMIDTIDRDMVKLIKRSNCKEIVLGLEHGDREMLQRMNKKLDLNKAYDVIKMLVEEKIPHITIFIIVGYPGENEERFGRGLNYLRQVKRLGDNVSVWVNIAQPYPGTRLLERCRREGYVDPSIDNFLVKKNVVSTTYSVSITTPDFDEQKVLCRRQRVYDIFSSSHSGINSEETTQRIKNDMVHILLCGWYFQGNTGDDLSIGPISKTLSKYGELRISTTEIFDPEIIDWCHILVIGSGSHITSRGISCYPQVKYAKEKGKRVVYYSQTIEAGHPMFHEHLSRADLITVRDHESKKVAESHGFRAVLASDPIFVKKRRAIGFSFRRWVNEPGDIEDRLATILDDLSLDYDIISIPYTPNETDTESDISFHDKVISKMKYKPHHVPYDEGIKKIDLLIGMRLHALINAVNQGEKILAIDYDTKVGRIFSDLAMSDRVISYEQVASIPLMVRNRIFKSDALALREKVNEALIARMCADIKGEPSPKVSIVMPTYNRANYLKEAIDSILTQTIQDWELIIMDGGSTDNTKELVESYREERIRYYNFGHNGISYSRNIGNLLSRGEIIVVADSDDINLPNRLEVSCQEMEKSKADIIYSSMFHFDDTGKKELIPSHPFSYERLKEGNFIYHPTVAYRRDVAMTCPYNEDLEMVEDYHLYLQAAEKGYKFHQVEEPLAMHRLHTGQISSVRNEEMAEIHRRLVESEDKKIKKEVEGQKPLVSVMVPTYNRPGMLKEALMSILSQTYQNFEVMVVNDAGDDIRDVIDALNKEGKIIYLQHKENKGLPAARNTGLKAAKGKYIAYLDDDDIYYPNHLETLVNFLEKSDYKVAYTDSYHVFQEWITDRYVTVGKKIIYSHDFDRQKLLVYNYIPVLNVIHRKDIIEVAGLYDVTLGAHEDWDMWIRLSQYGDFYHINIPTTEVSVRTDRTTMTSRTRMPFLKTMEIIHNRYSHLVTNFSIFEEQKKTEEGLAREVEIGKKDSSIPTYEYLHRYRFAREFVRGKKVLNLACGEGDGSFMLSEEADSVIGIDIKDAAIRHASSSHTRENLTFIKGSITDVPIEEEKIFDAIVYFEAMENIQKYDKLMMEVKRLLKPDGIFIVSISNKYLYSDVDDYGTPIHAKRLYPDDLKKLLSDHFKNILLYGQKVYPTSNIFPLYKEAGYSQDFIIEKGDEKFLFGPLEKRLANAFIAVASDHIIDKNVVLGNSHLLDISETLFRQKDTSISLLEGMVTERGAEIESLRTSLVEKGRELSQRDSKVSELTGVLSEKDNNIYHLENMVRDREATLNHIYNSHGWKVLLRFYRFRDRLLPEGTRRRAMVKLLFRLPSLISGNSVRKGIKYARLYGIKGFFRKVNAKLRYNPTYNIQTKPVSVPVITAFEFNVPEDNIPPEDVKVSVIIPTKDAGEEFDHALRMIRKQKGIRDVELIVVDSGSSDKTLEIARKYDAHIISIQPEDFSHSAARNLGAENASGSLLFFTVQDAILPSERFLYEFYRVLKENGVGAVSCVEFCKENADLIYSAMAWYHAHFLGLDAGDRILSLPEKETHVTLRQNAQLSNTACFVRKDIFDQYRFRLNYAEDLDLGVRLIKDGYKLALLGSVRIIHSHNRPAYYYLKRGYVDSRYLTEILPDFPVPVIRFEDLIRDIVTSYNLLNEFVKEDLLSLHTPCTLDHFMEFVKERFKLKEKNRQLVKGSINDIDYVDGNFKDFVEGIRRQLPEEETTSLYNGILLISLLNFNETVFAFMKDTYEIFDKFILEEFIQSLYKAFALLCGSHIAYCDLKAANREHMLNEMIGKLRQGL